MFGVDERRLKREPPRAMSGGRLYLHYGRTLDAAEWERRHAEGLVPDRLPYGLDHLARSGLELTVRSAPRPSAPRALASKLARGLAAGLEPPELVRERGRRRDTDLVVCWDERTGAAAAARSRLPGEPPTASGVIWLTEPGTSHGARSRLAARELARSACVWVNALPQLDVLASWGVPPDQRHFVPMGVDADFWNTGDVEPEPWLVVGGGNDRHRDHPLLLRALRRLRERRPELRLELATRQPLDVPGELGARHAQLEHRAMRALYARASVVALAIRPNLHLSGLTTILEAMSCARPVVATETAGMAEYIRHGETGLLVAPAPEAIESAVEELLLEPERARELGRRGREVLERRFTTEHLAARLAELFGPIAR